MRVILRSTKTGQFWAGEGKWATQSEEAYDFKIGLAAINFVMQSHMADVEMILSFDDPSYDLRFRLGDSYNRHSGPR